MSSLCSPWKTIRLGTGLRNVEDFCRAINGAGCKINDWASDIISKPAFSASTKEVEVDLVVRSTADLGFPKGACRKDIYARAQELGFGLCPAEVGPQLRLQYSDQPKRDWLLIAMEPIVGSVGLCRILIVGRHDHSPWIDAEDGSSNSYWFHYIKWIFCLQK